MGRLVNLRGDANAVPEVLAREAPSQFIPASFRVVNQQYAYYFTHKIKYISYLAGAAHPSAAETSGLYRRFPGLPALASRSGFV